MNDFHTKNAKVFKALGDEKRLVILELLQKGEKCACVLMEHTKMSQSALSYHMKILCESGIVKGRQDGKWTHYSLDPSGSTYAVKLLTQLTTPESSSTKTM